MQVTKITVGYKRTFSFGPSSYEGVTLWCEQCSEILEDEDPAEKTQELFDACKQAIKANVPPNYRPVVQSSYKVAGLEVQD